MLMLPYVESSSKPVPEPAEDTLSPTPRPTASRGTPRTPRRVALQPKRLEALDDALGPLGPLGDNAPVPVSKNTDQPPAPPEKETSLPYRSVPTAQSRPPPTDGVGDGEGRIGAGKGRFSPQVQPSQTGVQRNTTPSVSVEQAAKPSFDISVGDPHKVGDMTSSHIVYQVRTKVRFLDRFGDGPLTAVDYLQSIPPTRLCGYEAL